MEADAYLEILLNVLDSFAWPMLAIVGGQEGLAGQSGSKYVCGHALQGKNLVIGGGPFSKALKHLGRHEPRGAPARGKLNDTVAMLSQ